MATNITERNKLKQELAGLGYSLKYIDEWTPKTRLYRHKPSYSTTGEIMEDVGTYMDNVPGNPDYVQKKARIGLFTWKPSSECECKWCGETFAKTEVLTPKDSGEGATETCKICGFKMEAKSKFGLGSKVRSHKSKVHPE